MNLIRSPKIVLIIQARMGSKRLPGKSMMNLSGAPLVGRIIERVKRCTMCDTIALATTHNVEDNILEELAYSYKINVFRGSENDLVDRYYQAARKYGADIIVRLPADNPVPEPTEIDHIIAYYLEGGINFASNLCNIFENGYPDGIGAEVFSYDILQKIWQQNADPHIREHLTLFFYDYYSGKVTNPSIYSVGTVKCPEEFRRPDLKLDVNTTEEYQFMSQLYEYLYPRNPTFTIKDIINWYDFVYKKNLK